MTLASFCATIKAFFCSDFDYPKEIYIPFYTRISPYLWGILFAYIMLRMPKFHRRKPGMRRLPWVR